jgi:hypothetical protein
VCCWATPQQWGNLIKTVALGTWLASRCLGNVFLFSTTSRQFLWPTRTASAIFPANLPEQRRAFLLVLNKWLQRNVGFGVLTAVTMKIYIFWDIISLLYSPVKVNRRFEGIYRLHIQGRRVRQAANQREVDSSLWLFHAGFLLGLLFGLQQRRCVPPKRRLTFTGLYGVIFYISSYYRRKFST